MDKSMVEKFLAYVWGNEVNTDILLDYKNSMSVGDFHFENGLHFPVLIPGLKADGVYIGKEYIIDSGRERDGSTTLSRARRFCDRRGYVLPPKQERDNMIYGDGGLKLLTAMRTLGLPKIQGREEYWAEDDKAYIPDSGSEGNVYADTNGVAPSLKYKRVRGCKRVKPELLFKADWVTSPVGAVLSEMMIPAYSYKDYLDGLGICYPDSGWYLTRNGEFSEETTYDEEKGICVTPNLCLDLNMHGAPMTAEEADVYRDFYGLTTPSNEQLLLLQKYAPRINSALDKIDMADMHIPETDIEQKCWSAEALYNVLHRKQNSDSKRWFLPVLELNTVPEVYVLLAELGVNV